MKIIALKGKNGSGKSTVAAMLAKKLDEKGISNKVLSFAEPLKKIVNYIYDDVIDFENRKEKENNRNLLETTADAIKSSFGFNPFVVQVTDTISTNMLQKDGLDIAIISDLRFKSEYIGLKQYTVNSDNFIVIEINNVLTQNNPSEYDLDLIEADFILNFDGTIENQLDSLIEELL